MAVQIEVWVPEGTRWSLRYSVLSGCSLIGARQRSGLQRVDAVAAVGDIGLNMSQTQQPS